MASHNDDFPGSGLIDRAQHDELDGPVRTLAETFYESGFHPDRALNMAWSVALLPELSKRVIDEGNIW